MTEKKSLSGDADSNLRFIRWQGVVMAQFSVAIGLLSTLAIASIATEITFLGNKEFLKEIGARSELRVSCLLLFGSILWSSLATITRLLDFRLTAKKVRTGLKPNLMGLTAKQLGQMSWILFWLGCITLLLGDLFLFLPLYSALFNDR